MRQTIIPIFQIHPCLFDVVLATEHSGTTNFGNTTKEKIKNLWAKIFGTSG